MSPSGHRAAILAVCTTVLIGSACAPSTVNQFPVGFTLRLSQTLVNAPNGGVGVDTLIITAVGSFSAQVSIVADSTVDCTVTPDVVGPSGTLPVEAVATCSRPTPGTSGIQFTASSPGYQNAFGVMYLEQH